MLHALFSFKGRLNRGSYWGFSMLLLAALWLPLLAHSIQAAFVLTNRAKTPIADLQTVLEQKLFWPLLVLHLIYVWPSAALKAKRFHDHGYSGWLALIFVVPLLASGLVKVFLGQHGSSPAEAALIMMVDVVVVLTFLGNFVFLGCVRGTIGPNAYGADPVPSFTPQYKPMEPRLQHTQPA